MYSPSDISLVTVLYNEPNFCVGNLNLFHNAAFHPAQKCPIIYFGNLVAHQGKDKEIEKKNHSHANEIPKDNWLFRFFLHLHWSFSSPSQHKSVATKCTTFPYQEL